MSSLSDLTTPRHRRRTLSGVFDAQVAQVLGDGTVRVKIPDYDDGKFTYGPAPWPAGTTGQGPDGHTHQQPAPSTGLWCAVTFVAGDVDRPRVLAAYSGWEPT